MSHEPVLLHILSPVWVSTPNGSGYWSASARWEEADRVEVSGGTFILLASHIGNSPDNTIDDLVSMMGRYRLDPYWRTIGRKDKPDYHADREDWENLDPSGYWNLDPCEGARNPHAGLPGEETWIDGPRMFSGDGVYSFHGNFYRYSYGFSIYTNHPETIGRLMLAITENCQMTEDHPEVEALEVGRKAEPEPALKPEPKTKPTTPAGKSSTPNLSSLLGMFGDTPK